MVKAEGKSRKTSAKKISDEGCETSHHLKLGHSLQHVVGRTTQHVRAGEGGEKRKGWTGLKKV